MVEGSACTADNEKNQEKTVRRGEPYEGEATESEYDGDGEKPLHLHLIGNVTETGLNDGGGEVENQDHRADLGVVEAKGILDQRRNGGKGGSREVDAHMGYAEDRQNFEVCLAIHPELPPQGRYRECGQPHAATWLWRAPLSQTGEPRRAPAIPCSSRVEPKAMPFRTAFATSSTMGRAYSVFLLADPAQEELQKTSCIDFAIDFVPICIPLQ